MAIYTLSTDAKRKIAEIYEYSYLNFAEVTADEYFMSLHETMNLLAEQPNLGRKFYEFQRFEHREHTIFYEIRDNDILIVNIFHQSEDIMKKL
ncbi:MAG: type II toxin-antitoxin system RelE/ParE family toxin [Alphaproteobacteria bacterium]